MPKPTALHAVTMSTLRRGEAITPVPTHTISDHCSCQLASSLRANYYAAPVARAAIIMDTERLYADITTCQLNDEVSRQKLSDIATPSDSPFSDPSMQWTKIGDSPLLYLGCPHVPNIDDLRLRVLQTFHDHITAGHFGQSKTYNLVSHEFFWPGLQKDIQAFVKSCVMFLSQGPT